MSQRARDEVISGFTEEQASRLTGVSVRQLGYWANDGFFVPGLLVGGGARFDVKLYSFRDLVSLKVLNFLRNETKIPFSHLRDVKERLSHLGESVWSQTTLYVLGRRVVFDNPETGEKEDAGNGQGVLQIPLQVVTGNMRDAIRKMRLRPDASLGKIDVRTAGKKNPLVAGTRIPIRSIQDLAEAGFSISGIREQFPSLTEADVRAAIGFRTAA